MIVLVYNPVQGRLTSLHSGMALFFALFLGAYCEQQHTSKDGDNDGAIRDDQQLHDNTIGDNAMRV